MSTTPTPTPGGSPGGDATFDAILAQAFTGDAPTGESPAETPVVEGEPVSADAETPPPAETTAEEPPPPEPPEEDEPEDEQKAVSQPLDLKSSRGKRIYGSYKAFKAITEKLGFEPSVEDIDTFHRLAGDVQAMEADWDSDDPRTTAQFIERWSARSPKGLHNLTQVFPDLIARIATTTNQPQLYTQLAGGVLDRYSRALYTQAAEAADPELKKSLTLAAQVIEWQLKGTFKEGPPPTPQADPLAEREQSIAAREAALRAQATQTYAAQQSAFIVSTDDAIDASLAQSVDQALASIKPSYQPAVYDAVRAQFMTKVRDGVSQVGEAFKQFQLRYGRAVQARSEQAKADVVRAYASMASRVIQAQRSQFLKSAAQEAVAQSGARHAQLAANAARVNPASGSPVQQSILPPLPANARASERLDRKFAELGI